MPVTTLFLLIQVSILLGTLFFSAAENRDFGRFVTTWYSVHCKHTRFIEFLGLLNEFFLEEAWVWGVRVGFGGREGALASALIGTRESFCDQFWRPYIEKTVIYRE